MAVPLLAVLNAGIKSLLYDEVTEPEQVDPLDKDTTEEFAEEAETDTGAGDRP
jgi:hypothetical protein